QSNTKALVSSALLRSPIRRVPRAALNCASVMTPLRGPGPSSANSGVARSWSEGLVAVMRKLLHKLAPVTSQPVFKLQGKGVHRGDAVLRVMAELMKRTFYRLRRPSG